MVSAEAVTERARPGSLLSQLRRPLVACVLLLGVYIAHDEMPRLGQDVRVCFSVPDSEREVSVDGSVAWLNPRQQHPVHSLPPGFGVQFRDLSSEDARAIERVIADYRARQPTSG